MKPRASAFAQIASALGRTRARLRLRAALLALGWVITAVGAVALIMVLLAAAIEASWLRGVSGVLLVGATTGVLWRFFIRIWWQSRTDRAVAAHLEDGLPVLRDGLLACVELHATPERANPELHSALQRTVAERLEEADIPAVTPFRPVRTAWYGVGAAALIWGLAVLIAPGTITRGFATLAPGVGLVGPDGALQTGPLVGDLTLTLHYPEHTGRPPQVIPNSAGDFQAPKGTRVEIAATTLEPAREAHIAFGKAGEGAQLPLLVRQERDVRAEFVVSKAERWRFAITTTGGEQLVEALDRFLKLEPDDPPQIELLLPEKDLHLEDLRRVQVRYQAKDDFGLSKVNIMVALAADPENPEAIEQAGVKGKTHKALDEVDLSIIQAQPGDRIALFVEAFDNHSVDGPQRGTSAIRYITVESPQEKHYALSDDLREVIEKLILGLADRLEMAWGEGQLVQRIDAVNAENAKAAEALAKVIDAMVGDPLTPKEVRLALLGRLGSLEEALGVEKGALAGLKADLDAGAAPAIASAKANSEAAVDQLEQAIILVEAMVARLALEDMQALVDEMRSAQERLREMVRQYKENPDDAALKKRITREIHRIRQRMDEIRRRMRQLRQKLPEEFLNLEGMKNSDVSKGLKDQMDQLAALEKMLEEGRMDDALAALDQMQQQLDEMSAALDKDLKELHENSNPEMQKALSELMDRTRDLMARQKEVADKTEALSAAEREQMRKLFEEQLKEKLEAVQKKGQALEQSVAEVRPDQLQPRSAEELGHVEQRVTDLNGTLERKAIMEALEMAERSLDHLDRMERIERPNSPEQGRIGKSQQLAKEIAAELAQMAQDARQQMRQSQQGQAQQMQQLGQQQQQLSEAAQQLGQRIRDGAQKIPGMGEKPMESLQRAQQAMQDAAQRLRGQRPGQARPGQEQAMSELQQLMEGLKQANQPQKANRRGEKDGGRETSLERVEIPKADRSPDTFRQELLEAMKDDAPDAYREQVKRYYEALIK